MKKGTVVQFKLKHKFAGCLGIVDLIEQTENDTKYRVLLPIPQEQTAYINVLKSENAIEEIGMSVIEVKL